MNRIKYINPEDLEVKDLKDQDVLLVNESGTGRRAAFIKSGRVIDWNPMVSRKCISEAVNRPLDWSAQNLGRYAIAE